MQTESTLHDAKLQGANAFKKYGITGINRHNYAVGTYEIAAFIAGFTETQHAAHEKALADNLAYHTLSLRDTNIDRKWAEKLSNANPIDTTS